MLETAIQQVFVSLMPAFYIWLFGFFLIGIKAGLALRDYSVWAAISIWILGNNLPDTLESNLISLVLSGCCFAFTMGILFGYLPRWISKEVMSLFRT